MEQLFREKGQKLLLKQLKRTKAILGATFVSDDLMAKEIGRRAAALVLIGVQYWGPTVREEFDRMLLKNEREQRGLCTRCEGPNPNRSLPGLRTCSVCKEAYERDEEAFWNEIIPTDLKNNKKKEGH